MHKRVVYVPVVIAAALGAFLWAGSSVPTPLTGQSLPQPVIRYLGTSHPLRGAATSYGGTTKRVLPLRQAPAKLSLGLDPAVQLSVAKLLSTTAGLNFEGFGSGAFGSPTFVVAPPDANGAAGGTQYVQWANLDLTIFDKTTGGLVSGPTPGNALFSGITAPSNCGTTNDGEPVVNYDAAAGRWILAQTSFSLANPPASVPYEECIAISTTSDATGTYYLYSFQDPSNLIDSFKLGVWSDAYYTTANSFQVGTTFTTFVGTEICAFDRSVMLSGGALTPGSTLQCKLLDTTVASYPSVLPASLDGATTPPAGSPEFFMNLGVNSLNLWKFHVDFSTPANSTLTGPTNIPVAPFNNACGSGTCIAQVDTTQLLDSRADRLMYRLAYRNFGDHEALVVNHSVTPFKQKNGTKSMIVSGIRWYELRSPNSSPVIFQQGTYVPDTSSRWMGSIATDKAGDIAVGYSVSSSSLHPAIRYTGRTPTDPLGMMESEVSIFEGLGSQLTPLSRWGDYNSMTVDPIDDCTFYYTNEYLLADGTFNWNTRIASFKFSRCQ